MKLQITKDVLVNVLGKVDKAVGKSSIPVLQGVYFEATADALNFIGSNDEQTISVTLPVDETITVNEPGKIVFGKGILDIVKKLRSDVITITTDELSFQYFIEAGLSKFNFSGYDAEEYPKFTEPSDEPILEFAFEELKEYVDKLAFAASTEDSRPILQGIHIIGNEGTNQLKLIATNSHILSQKIVSKEVTEDISIVPKAKSLVDTLRVFNSSDTITVFSTATHLIFKSEEVTVRTRLLEGNYPATDRLVMTEFKAVLEIDKIELLNALEQVEIVGHSTSNNTPNAATISVSGLNLKIENNSTEMGKAEVEIPLVELQKNEEQDEEIKFAFNVKYLINVVKATDGNIQIGYVGSMRPISILGTESNAEYKLILPIRTR
ncbi:DNA polymerase III subunit beta [Viridibacillus arvi]|uniref:DNA polymerase III subunit beta n=1 Tax=Viridibacillus arvi TaxID=263475 RepID=UPI0034CD8FD4